MSRLLDLTALAAGAAVWGVLASAQSVTTPRAAATDPRDWPIYGGTTAGTRYSTLKQINRDNVSRLQIAWQFDPKKIPGDSEASGGLQVNPIVVAGVIYTLTPGGSLVALDGATGTVRWSFS